MDLYTIKFRLQLAFMQSWPLAGLAWLLSKNVPEEEDFGKFKGQK